MTKLVRLSDLVRCRHCGRLRPRAATNHSFCRLCWARLAARLNRELEKVKRSFLSRVK